MTARAFVLVETAMGRHQEVVITLGRLKWVKSVDAVTEPYDIIAVIERAGLSVIGDLVTGKINPIAGIYRTVTCLAM